MRYRALGPITVEVDGKASKLGGLRQQMVLAVLLSRANQVVPQDTLIDAVWSGEPPEAARATLQSYIYNLRRSVTSGVILRRGDGYLIEADATNFDILDFSSKLRNGLDLLQTDPAAARSELVGGLALWFGFPYGGVDHVELHGEIHRLTEMRVNAIEARIDADLALGRDRELVGELEVLTRDFPLRERFWGQLMLALYRSGRQAEALRTYQQARSRLVDELGIEPGSELQQLEERVLGHDPTLLLERSFEPATRGDPVALRGYELREVLGSTELGVAYRAYQHSVGREVVVKSIRPEFANDANFVARFEREAQIIAGLGHPHILPLHDYWRDPNGAYLVVPFMNGGSLASSLRIRKWNLEPAIRLLVQVGGALSHAHRRGVIHGHMSASSVVLDDEGNAYLGDFGIGLPSAAETPTVRTDAAAMGRLTLHLLTGIAPDDELDTTALPAGLSAVVEQATAKDPQARYARVSDYLRDLRRAAGVDVSAGSDLVERPGEPVRNPYKGLRAFTELDSADFHGRSELIDHLLQSISENRLVTIVGPSGSGKSSVVRAGVIPALRAGALAGSHRWLVTDMFPGSYPFEELEAALTRVSVVGSGEIMSELSGPTGLLRVCKRILPEDSTLLLFVDQFEELFSLVRSEEVRHTFIDNLVAVADDERGRIRVVTTIRADFLDRPLTYGDFAASVSAGLVTVGPPTREGLARSIAAPARSVGLDLEPGLVPQVVADVEGQPGALPLLQYALTETFGAREGATLTIAAYEATGGVAGAVGRRAEELFEGLSPIAGEVAREVFLRLVSVDESGAVTRRRARQSDLRSLAVDRSALETVLNAFARFRLLSFDRDPVTRGPTVEVAHEALLTKWPRLASWIEEARDTLVMARRLGESAHDWVTSDRDPSYLVRGSRLDDVKQWAASGVALTSDEKDFISASVVQREQERAASRQRRQRVLVALSFGLVLVSLFAILAFYQRGVARREATLSMARELAGISRNIPENPELSLLIAAEAFDVSVRDGGQPMQQAVTALAQAIHDWRLVARFPGLGLFPSMPSSDGSSIVTASADDPSTLTVFSANGDRVSDLLGPEANSVEPQQGGPVSPIAEFGVFHPGGELVAAAYSSKSGSTFRTLPDGLHDIIVFQAASGEPVSRIDLAPVLETPSSILGRHYVMSFSPSGNLLALSSENLVVIVDWPNEAEVRRVSFPGITGTAKFLSEDTILVPVQGVGWTTYSIDEDKELGTIAVAGMTDIAAADATGRRLVHRAGGFVEVIDAANGEILVRIEDPGTLSVAITPAGDRFAYSGYDSTIHVVDVDGTNQDLQLNGAMANVLSLAFAGPRRLLTNGENPLLWDVSPSGVEAVGVAELASPQWGFQISPEDRWLAYIVAANAGAPIFDPGDGIRLVDLASGDEILTMTGEVASIDVGLRWVSPDFTLFGSLREDGSSSLRRLPSWEPVKRFERCRVPLLLSPEGSRVLLSGTVCGDDPEAAPNTELIDLETDESLLALPYRSTFSADFNPEGVFEAGRYLAATDQATLGVWDTRTGARLGVLQAPASWEAILVVRFDPTGRYLVGGTSAGTAWVVDFTAVVDGASLEDALVFSRQAHTGATPAPDLSSTGVVATPGFDGLIRLWDLASGRLLFEFESDMTTPFVRFAADGSRLFYPHGLSIRQIPSDPHQLRSLAAELLTRDFLPDECERYSRTGCD